MMTPPLSILAKPALTRKVPVRMPVSSTAEPLVALLALPTMVFAAVLPEVDFKGEDASVLVESGPRQLQSNDSTDARSRLGDCVCQCIQLNAQLLLSLGLSDRGAANLLRAANTRLRTYKLTPQLIGVDALTVCPVLDLPEAGVACVAQGEE